MSVENKAEDIINRLGQACFDLANGAVACPGCNDEEVDQWIQEAKDNGSEYVAEYVAEMMYEDIGTMQDFIGDWSFDAASGDKENQKLILKHIAHKGHNSVMKKAAIKLLERKESNANT